ncbi:MAG: NADH-quinone oxidoreductase subunit C [Acidimicrobiales bacterium]
MAEVAEVAKGSEVSEMSEASAASPDTARQSLVDSLVGALGDAVVGQEVAGDDVWVRVRVDAWADAARHCRNLLGMDYFCFLSGIDWMPSSQPNPEEAASETVIEGEGDDAPDSADAVEAVSEEPTGAQAGDEPDGWRTGVAGGETRFQVLARLYSTRSKLGITLKADLDEADPRVPTWVGIYAGADWHERETWEMFGFTFEGHENLTHLYLPGEFEGHPLRKDFPLLAREVKPWPGLVDVEPMPEEPEAPAATEGPEAAASSASDTSEEPASPEPPPAASGGGAR